MKYFAAILFCLAVLGISKEKIREADKKKNELFEFLSLVRHLKKEIGSFMKPIGKALENFKSKSDAVSELVLAVQNGEEIKVAYLRLSESFGLTDEIKAVLLRTFYALGSSYLEENLKILNLAEEELCERNEELAKKSVQSVKIIQTLSATVCAAVIIAVI